MDEIPPLYEHQEKMAMFAINNDRVLNTSDPGTGKTRGTLEGYLRRSRWHETGRLLVVAPLSILKPAWGDDIKKYFPGLSYAIAHGNEYKRRQALESTTDIVLLNHDGIKWLQKNPELLPGFTDLVIDEFTAFKNGSAQRSKSMLKASKNFEHITLLSGSPNPNTILDMWHPAKILDDGDRLGRQYTKFRLQVCNPEQVGPGALHIKWVDKPEANDVVADALSDITIRFNMDDCLDIPENILSYLKIDMPDKVMKAYKTMRDDALLETSQGTVTAIHAGSKVKKMLQVLSGAVYDQSGIIHSIHNSRYDLVMQLVMEREHTLVAFNWKHEREALVALAEKAGITYAVIDGSVSSGIRAKAVADMQAGKLKVLFCQPASAAHGLTLTKALTTIWCTPTYNAEHFQQFNRRIYRSGQTKKTETICIAANDTHEVEVYERLNGKLDRMSDMLSLFSELTKDAA